jgi:multiple sugar transport system permease protein
MTRRQKRTIGTVARYTFLTLWALVVAFPLFWIVSTSFKPSDQWFSWPPVYLPSPPTLENYSDVWVGATDVQAGGQMALSLQTPFVALRNTLILAFAATTLAVLYGAVIAYGVSRYRLLSETRMFQLLMLRMVPPIVIVAPLSLYFSYVGLLDSMFGLGALYFLTSLPYAVWMTKSFIDEVPREVEQAAEILGASRWRSSCSS